MVEDVLYSLLLIILEPLFSKGFLSLFNITISAAIIGAFGSIFGGIIGGLVAYFIAKMQIENEKNNKIFEENKAYRRHQQLLINEIETNQLFLSKITSNTDKEVISSIINFSISNQLFLSLNTYLRINEFYETLLDYYRVFYRIQNDPIFADGNNLEALLAEIVFLDDTEKKIKNLIK